MKIGVMSDSHENMEMIARAIELFNQEGVDLVIHAGDIISPITTKEFKQLKGKLIAIFGNNDGERELLRERFSQLGYEIHKPPYEFILEERKILVLHEPYLLESLVRSESYDLIIYGHTHRIEVREGKTLVLNPGECGGWLSGKASIALVETTDLSCQIINLEEEGAEQKGWISLSSRVSKT